MGGGRILLLLILAAGVYLNTLTGPFLYDDIDEILANPRVHTLGAIPSLLTTDFWYGERGKGILYRPVLAATIPPIFVAGDGSPWPFHLSNLLLHALVSWLFASIASRLLGSRDAGFITGALFALHPVHAEAVAWISGRSELLFTFFGAAAWRFHLKSREGGGALWTLLAALGLALSLGSKETAVCWPLIFMAGDWLGRARGERLGDTGPPGDRYGTPPGPQGGRLASLVRLYGIYLAVGLAWAGSRYLVLGRIGSAGDPLLNPLVGRAWWPAHPFTSLRTLGLAAAVTSYPARPCFDYGFDQVRVSAGPADPDVLATMAGLAALAVAAWLAGGRRAASPSSLRGVVLGTAVFLLAWLPVSSLIVSSVTIFAERNTYLPSLGWCLAAASIADLVRWRLARRRALLLAAGLTIAAVMGVLTIARNRDFRDHLTLIASSAENCPRSARAHYLRAAELVNTGRMEESLPAYRRAIGIAPGYAEARADLARALARLGRRKEAVLEARAAAASPPDDPGRRLAVVAALAATGLKAEADALFEETRRQAPDDGSVLFVEGERLKAEGSLDAARGVFTRLRDRYPWSPVGYVGLASIHALRGEVEAARRELEEALRRDPHDARTLYDLGLLSLRAGPRGAAGDREALELLDRYVALRPEDAMGWVRLGQAQERLGQIEAAEDSYRQGVAAALDHPAPRRALYGFLKRQGREAEAEALGVTAGPEED